MVFQEDWPNFFPISNRTPFLLFHFNFNASFHSCLHSAVPNTALDLDYWCSEHWLEYNITNYIKYAKASFFHSNRI